MASIHWRSFRFRSSLSSGNVRGRPRVSITTPTVPPKMVVVTDRPFPAPTSSPRAGRISTSARVPLLSGMHFTCPKPRFSSISASPSILRVTSTASSPSSRMPLGAITVPTRTKQSLSKTCDAAHLPRVHGFAKKFQNNGLP